MTDASSDSDESAGRVQEWEVVSMSVLSMSGSAGNCACESCAAAMPDDGTGSTVVNGPNAATLLSNHFGSARSISTLDEFLGAESESRTDVEEDRGDVRGELQAESGKRPEDLESPTEQEEPRRDVKHKEEDVSGSENYKSTEMDWIEPSSPKNHSLLRDEGDATSSVYNEVYDIATEKKPESDCREEAAAGPLFGSCMSTPSAAAIVSSVAAFRAGLGEDLIQSPMEGDESLMSANCVVEEELAGLERDVLGSDSGFSSFHESPVVAKKLDLDDRQEEEGLLVEGAEDHACEAWWKRSAALWCVQTRQANTLWSLALAAAVMGLVILGQRWQHERCENNHLRLQLCSKDEKISQLIFQVARLKDALSGRRRVPVLRTSSSYSGFRERF
ncbi:hypothetical protein R1flu_006988 [Riccia fluitans]|uniref:DUF6821 domain-containing protein n=1 Tax=Riccia fluitans TaxID=41844 RepID=A0ABD1YXL7_9MARC